MTACSTILILNFPSFKVMEWHLSLPLRGDTSFTGEYISPLDTIVFKKSQTELQVKLLSVNPGAQSVFCTSEEDWLVGAPGPGHSPYIEIPSPGRP